MCFSQGPPPLHPAESESPGTDLLANGGRVVVAAWPWVIEACGLLAGQPFANVSAVGFAMEGVLWGIP